MRKSQNPQNPLDKKICDVDMSVRLWNVLRSLNVKTIGDMLKFTLVDYAIMRNVGKVTIKEIRSLYEEYGVEYK